MLFGKLFQAASQINSNKRLLRLVQGTAQVFEWQNRQNNSLVDVIDIIDGV